MNVADNPAENRFEAYAEDTLAGFAEYELSGGAVSLVHTEVLPDFEGQGVGSTLTRAALDTFRARGNLKVKPVCPFVAGWVARHPEYQDLIAE